MAHRFRNPNPQDKQIRKLAALITDAATLERVLGSCKSRASRIAVYERIKPHLGFTPLGEAPFEDPDDDEPFDAYTAAE